MWITARTMLVFAMMCLTQVAVPAAQQSIAVATPQEPPPLDRLIVWLDDPATAWVATAWLQQLGKRALPALLTPGRTLPGPHGRFSPRMLALAKIGEPAISAISERMAEIRRGPQRDTGEALALVQVLGGIGPAAIPALVELASGWTSGVVSSALEQIVAFEPREWFGNLPDPWLVWCPQDDRQAQIAGYITPLLPRIREVMEREARAWRPQSSAPHRPAAYLLARWGSGQERARGLEVLDGLARADQPFYNSLESARLLYSLRAPGVASLLRQIAAQIPITYDLKDQYLLQIGIALFNIGDASYLDMIAIALRGSNLYAQKMALGFASTSGDLRLAPLLINLLGDNTETGSESFEDIKGQTIRAREVIGDSAAASLRTLTFQSIGRDSARWREWWKRNSQSSHRKLQSQFIRRLARGIKSIPIWEANRRIGDLRAATGAQVIELLRAYIDRPDLNASAVGPNASRGTGSFGPIGQNGPRAVTLLLRFVQLGQEESRSLLERATRSVDADVRLHAALAIGSYDRRAGVDHLAREIARPDKGSRSQAALFILALNDARGIPVLIDRLASDHDSTRHLGCRDLRLYTQHPLPCDSTLPSPERAANIQRWRSWWSAVPAFKVKGRQAALDHLAGPEASPVSFNKGLHVSHAESRPAT